MCYTTTMKRLSAIFLALAAALVLAACGTERRTLRAPVTDESAGAITIYAYEPDNEPNYGLMYLGHAFLSVENLSSQAVSVGAITLQPGESCSIGSWGMTHHFGVWYNVESSYIHAAGKYGGRVSVTKGIEKDDFAKIGDYVAANDSWSLLTNCARFAANIFNLTSGDQFGIGGLVTPTRLAKAIRAFREYEVNRPIENFGKVGYYEEAFIEYAYEV